MAGQTEPAVKTGGGSASFRVTPQERAQACGDEGGARRSLSACKDEAGKGRFTVDGGLSVGVSENAYPGKREPIRNKWVYVVCEGKLVAEADARNAFEWHIGYEPDPKAKPEKRVLKGPTLGRFRLDGGPPDQPYRFGFFLSPVRLSPGAIDLLLKDDGKGDSALVWKAFTGSRGEVAVPDPFRWACDAHLNYYQPALDEYQELIHDPEVNAKLFIASVLKGWLQNGDPARIRGMLRGGEPDAFLKEYEKEEKDRRTAAEKAMAYVAHCVQSSEHRVVEKAAEETKGEALANAFFQFAAVSHRANEIAPGRQLLADIMGDENRIPRRFLFSEKPESKGFEFAEWRFTWLAALASFNDLVTAWVDSSKAKGVDAAFAKADLLRKYLEKLDVKTLKGKEITYHRNVISGRPSDAGFGSGASARKRFREINQKMLAETDEFRKELVKAQGLEGPVAKAEKVHATYSPWLARVKLSAGTVVELANLVIAVDDWLEAKKDKGDKTWSLVGACADMAAQVLTITEAILARRAGGEVGKAVGLRLMAGGGVLGLVSGACDMRDFAGKAGQASGQNDYAKMVGHGIAGAGAAAVALGGGMTLAFALSGEVMFAGAAGGPIGLVVAAIGSVIIIGGCAIAAWLSDNNFQSYAKLCSFGKDADAGKTVYFEWTSTGLGGGSPVGEARALVDLLSHFNAERWDEIQTDRTHVTVHPGHVGEGSQFEVWYDRRAYTGKTAPEGRSMVGISLQGKGEILRPEGLTDPMELTVVRDPKDPGVVRKFTLVIPTLDGPDRNPAFPVRNVWIRLNVDGEGRQWTPKDLNLLKLPHRDNHDVNKYSSLEPGQWVTTGGQPYED